MMIFLCVFAKWTKMINLLCPNGMRVAAGRFALNGKVNRIVGRLVGEFCIVAGRLILPRAFLQGGFLQLLTLRKMLVEIRTFAWRVDNGNAFSACCRKHFAERGRKIGYAGSGCIAPAPVPHIADDNGGFRRFPAFSTVG